VQAGYVTIAPDSFSPRGHAGGVCTDASPPLVTYRQRAADAYAALNFLQSSPFVDRERIAVMGGSHGGSSTLATIVDVQANTAAASGLVAAIALYPGCGARFGDWRVTRERTPGSPITGYSGVFKPLAPLPILTGALDDWTPAEPCRKLTETAQAIGYPVEIKIYPGAHHSFDSAFPLRYVAERRNFNAPGGHGATTAGNQEAWDDAVVRLLEFLAKRFAAADQRKP
jgi:dienelactone hydrolase